MFPEEMPVKRKPRITRIDTGQSPCDSVQIRGWCLVAAKDGRRESSNYAFVTLPLRRQPVHTRIFLLPWSVLAFTGRRLTFQRRLLTLWACEMLFPERGPLPQTSQTCAIAVTPSILFRGTANRETYPSGR